MQLKLLNFHKMIANLASNLVGAFVSLIIYQATGSLSLAILYIGLANVSRLICNIALKKLYEKYPQIFLLIRIIPIFIYNMFILLLDTNMWVAIIGICIFVGINNSMYAYPKELIFNYSSLNKSGDSIGITRLFEQFGTIVALIVGGYLLDFNKTIVIVISLLLYAISVVPLFMYYLKSRKNKDFNQEAVSNAIITKKNSSKDSTAKLSKKILFKYGVVYFTFAFIDLFSSCFNLHLFVTGGAYAVAGIFSAIYNLTYAVGSYIFGKLNDKKDLTIATSIISVALGGCLIALPFVENLIVLYIIYGIMGITYPCLSIFVLNRMLVKSRIMGVSNEALNVRENGCVVAYMMGAGFGAILPCLAIPLLPLFILMGVTMEISAVLVPKNEEQTRRLLIDFLQDNEIRASKRQ